jgi:hypothetical protein
MEAYIRRFTVKNPHLIFSRHSEVNKKLIGIYALRAMQAGINNFCGVTVDYIFSFVNKLI